jgi:hypothetical protein
MIRNIAVANTAVARDRLITNVPVEIDIHAPNGIMRINKNILTSGSDYIDNLFKLNETIKDICIDCNHEHNRIIYNPKTGSIADSIFMRYFDDGIVLTDFEFSIGSNILLPQDENRIIPEKYNIRHQFNSDAEYMEHVTKLVIDAVYLQGEIAIANSELSILYEYQDDTITYRFTSKDIYNNTYSNNMGGSDTIVKEVKTDNPEEYLQNMEKEILERINVITMRVNDKIIEGPNIFQSLSYIDPNSDVTIHLDSVNFIRFKAEESKDDIFNAYLLKSISSYVLFGETTSRLIESKISKNPYTSLH